MGGRVGGGGASSIIWSPLEWRQERERERERRETIKYSKTDLFVFLTMSSSLSESSITAFLGLTVLRFLYRIAVLLIIPDYRGKEINILTFPPVSGFALPRALAGVERGVETGVDTTRLTDIPIERILVSLPLIST